MPDFLFPRIICKCGSKIDTAAPTGKSHDPPDDGDVSFCLRCGQLFVFEDKNFRAMTDDEFLDLPLDFKEQLNQLERRRKEAMAIIDKQEKPDAAR